MMTNRTRRTSVKSALVLCAIASGIGCSSQGTHESSEDARETVVERQSELTTNVPLAQLPKVDPQSATNTFMQALGTPTKFGENAALYARLPPTRNRELNASLVRIVGNPQDPLVLFKSDALDALGVTKGSPGPDFFTAFVKFDPKELDARAAGDALIERGTFGDATAQDIVFNGRHPVGTTTGFKTDTQAFALGTRFRMGLCALRPASTEAAWGRSLLIRSPDIVKDPSRTWDQCLGTGTRGGVWSFGHLMRELSQGSGLSAEDFALSWLNKWVTGSAPNGDPLTPKVFEMFSNIIQPWATASGVTASLSCPVATSCSFTFSGPLNIDAAPFRLLAIVNRIDLGSTSHGSGGYGGGVTDEPTDAGELRFIFDVSIPSTTSPGTCLSMPFSAILEYGVPISGCSNVRSWARRWTHLNTYTAFDASYRSELEGITESVVLHGAAPTKGNQSALNQLRVIENIDASFQMLEFALATESASGVSTPASGALRGHTVALTPAANLPSGSTLVSDFIRNVVTPGTVVGTPLTSHCEASYTVPMSYLGSAFRGGRARMSPGFWSTSPAPATDAEICGRHQFSLNTCNGCHRFDAGTAFRHVTDVGISGFLSGGGAGMAFAVSDPQVSSVTWTFADLERRYQRLYDIAYCASCTGRVSVDASFLEGIQRIAGVLPIDPGDPGPKGINVGPITELAQVKQIIALRNTMAARGVTQVPVSFIRKTEAFSH